MPSTGFCHIILYLPEVMHNVCAYTLHLCVCLYIHTYIYILKEVKPLCPAIFPMKIMDQQALFDFLEFRIQFSTS